MSRQPYRPECLQWQVFRGSDILARRILTANQLRSAAWVRVRHDVYADSRLDHDHELACRAAALWLPAGAAFAGPSAAYLSGVESAAGFADEVHVVVPPPGRVEPQRGTSVHHTRLEAGDLAPAGQFRQTTAVRTAWDVARWLDPVRAVPIIDAMLRTRLVDPGALAALVTTRAGARGCRRAARAFDLADGRAESPPESRLRVRLALAGLPCPVPQHPVRLAGGARYRPDLSWPEQRVALEYDGEWHATAEQLHADRRRLNQLTGAGWIVLHATGQRLYREFPALLREVRTALRSRGGRC